jgi:CDP-glucose 4,6-dehydratase
VSPWASRRVLVTGATGVVGSWLTKRLLHEGAYVVALIRDLDPQSELMRSGSVDKVSVVSGELEDSRAVERAVVEHDVDTIVHLGAQTIVGVGIRSPVATFSANVQGTWNVLEAARLHGSLVRSVVIASSDKAYGTAPELPYTEEMPLRGVGPYDVSKSCTDLIAASYAQTYGVPLLIARCGNIYGGGDLNWSRIVPGTIRSLLEGRRPVLRSDGTFLRDYLHVDDVVDAYLLLGETAHASQFLGEAFNFSAESPLSVLEIYDLVCKAAVGSTVEPQVLGRAEHEIHDQYLSADKARTQLDWVTAVTIEDGLARTVEWYRQLFSDPTARSDA